jgi:hypothetical protein
MLRTCARVIALTVMLVGLPTAQAADTTLMLACKGTITTGDAKPEPISMGLIFNFTKRTVQGLSDGVKITTWDDVTVSFSHFNEDPETKNKSWSLGNIDRITGDLEASFFFETPKKVPLDVTTYTLKCRPAQRMF